MKKKDLTVFKKMGQHIRGKEEREKKRWKGGRREEGGGHVTVEINGGEERNSS